MRNTLWSWILLCFLSFSLTQCSNDTGNGSGSEPDETSNGVSSTKLTAQSVLTKRACNQCHRVDSRLVGPSYKEIAARDYSAEELITLIRKPNPDNWPGYTPMIGINISDEEGEKIVEYISSLKD